MPIATIQIIEGRDAQKKRGLMAAVAQAIATSLDAPIDNVRVIVQEVSADLWSVGNQTVAERRARPPKQ
jgi:4-oxalocrotonate tautomerase